jgi:nicotinamide-nucleotide amidase
MGARGGILITGTEVLSGRVRDRNGPWLAARLFELGVDLTHTTIVGDRPDDMQAALGFLAGERVDIIVTSGGLGPTADDKTVEVVGAFQGRPMIVDDALEGRIGEILERLTRRWPAIDREAVSAGNRKQATVPEGATVLEPVGTAPGLVVPPAQTGTGPTVVVLPGPPRELQPVWREALETEVLRAALSGAAVYRQRTLRLFGIPESEIAETLRVAERDGVALDRLEITTCLKRGEIEIVTRYEPDSESTYEQFAEVVKRRHSDTLFSDDGSSVDEQVAARLRGLGRSIATAESCTGGLLVARLTDPAGASDYVKGGIVAYSNEAKVAMVGVARELIESYGAVSAEVAQALAEGARSRLDADVGVGVTGIAGPGGGSEEKPVGLVWLSVAAGEQPSLTRAVNLPGDRADVRDRATTVAMHLLGRALADP